MLKKDLSVCLAKVPTGCELQKKALFFKNGVSIEKNNEEL